MKNDKHTVDVSSDKYFNDADFKDHFGGCDVVPVDINNAFVGVKGEAGILEKTEANIRRRFNLGGED